MQLSFFDRPAPDICRNNHGGNPESVKADRSTNKNRDCQRVLDVLRLRGQHGATCDEVETALGLSHQTCSARCAELLRDGAVIRKAAGVGYERRKTRSGRGAAVLVLR